MMWRNFFKSICFLRLIFWPPGWKSDIWLFLDPFRPFLSNSWLKREKMQKIKKMRHVESYLNGDLLFLIFSQERLKKGKQLHLRGWPKLHANFHVLCIHACACTCMNIVFEDILQYIMWSKLFWNWECAPLNPTLSMKEIKIILILY